jgi:hypothetical protein
MLAMELLASGGKFANEAKQVSDSSAVLQYAYDVDLDICEIASASAATASA